MKAYERRVAIRKAKSQVRLKTRQYDRAVHLDAVMRKYEDAHNLVMGYYPEVEYRHGRFHVVGQYIRSFLEVELVRETEKLYALIHEQEINNGS
jgi:hypothetical protein